jgi:hypothetical protein
MNDTGTSRVISAETVPGWVYFIQAGDAVKIGYSTGVTGRLRDMQTGNHHGLVLLAQTPGTMATERDYHRQFATFRIKGEWFRAVAEVMKEAGRISGKRYQAVVDQHGAAVHQMSDKELDLHHKLDCEIRVAGNPLERMAIALRMSMEKGKVSEKDKLRQDQIIASFRKKVVRVKAVSQRVEA